MKTLIILVSVLLLISVVSALRVEVKISPKIDVAQYIFYEKEQGDVQEFKLFLENVGSVGCRSRARLEFFNGSEKSLEHPVYIAWSKELRLNPGANGGDIIYTNLPNGSYRFFFITQHCFRQFEKGPFELFVNGSGNYTKGVIEIKEIKTFKSEIEITLKSWRDLENIAIIPTSYPFGWIFESAKVDRLGANRQIKVRLGYEPSIWEEAKVNFTAITLDGNFFDEKEVKLKLEKNIFEKILEYFQAVVQKIASYFKIKLQFS